MNRLRVLGSWGGLFAAALMLFAWPLAAFAAEGARFAGPVLGGLPLEFLLFAAVLLCVALFHDHTFGVAVTGAVVIALYKIVFSPFRTGPGLAGFAGHAAHEWVTLTNLLCLLLGFGVLSRYFEESRVPDKLPNVLPDDWKGGFVLLLMVFVLSSFLDNIAAAIIGGLVAAHVFRHKVHVGYLAAIVAASNAGGSGSVVGDTTTTMMWIAGVNPLEVLEAYVASGVALLVCGIPASIQQQRYSPIVRETKEVAPVDLARVGIVAFILALAIAVNIVVNRGFTQYADAFPFLGVTVWVAIGVSALVRRPDLSAAADSIKGTVFLLCLVLCASMMPVDELPPASWATVLGLGFVSAVFDNIPLTALAIQQGGYDWGYLAYAVGFGGSMMWFGSSAGVALSNMYPQARSVGRWLRDGWHVTLAYIVGFAVMLALVPWLPGVTKAGAPAAHQAAVRVDSAAH
mgnify:FL=1